MYLSEIQMIFHVIRQHICGNKSLLSLLDVSVSFAEILTPAFPIFYFTAVYLFWSLILPCHFPQLMFPGFLSENLQQWVQCAHTPKHKRRCKKKNTPILSDVCMFITAHITSQLTFYMCALFCPFYLPILSLSVNFFCILTTFWVHLHILFFLYGRPERTFVKMIFTLWTKPPL